MLLNIVLHQPQMLATIVARTPTWVWGLFAGLLVLGATQLRDRSASLLRMSLMPLVMTGFSAWGMASAFGSSPVFGEVLAVWLAITAAMVAALAPGRAVASYDPVRRVYQLPGSVTPLLLLAVIFLVKWCVGVEMAMQPSLVRDATFTLPVAAIYGVINGLFIGRAVRLWRLALQTPSATPLAA